MDRATLALPEGPMLGGLIPLHPAGDPSGDQLLFRHLAEALPPCGVAVLRYNRRPAAAGQDVPLHVQAEDALAAMAELRRRTGEPRLPVGFWGFSQGAWAAMLAAAADAAFLVAVSGSGVSPAEQMRYGTREQLVRAGYGARELAQLDQLRLAYEDYLRGNRWREEVDALIRATADSPWFELAWVPRELPEPGAWPDMDFDPAQALEPVACPMLAFFGEDDQWVPVGRSVERWRSAAARTGAPLAVIRLPGTSHQPTLGEAGPVSPLYEEALTGWLARVLRDGTGARMDAGTRPS